MRVLLVSANREHLPDPIFPLGLAYIVAAVKNAGHHIEVADLCFGCHPLDDLRKQVSRFKPIETLQKDYGSHPIFLSTQYLIFHVDTSSQSVKRSCVVG